MANSIKAFKKIGTKDPELSKVQNNVEIVLKAVLNSQIIDGILITDIELEAGKRNEIAHKLGRRPLGFIIVRKRADSRIWDLQDTNPGPLDTFTIACSHNVNVDIWIF